MAIEALNDAGFSKCKMTVILNDNEMSISPNIGGLNMFLSKLRTKNYIQNQTYQEKKDNRKNTSNRKTNCKNSPKTKKKC